MAKHSIIHGKDRSHGHHSSLTSVVRVFWANVQTRLQRQHKVSAPRARKAVLTYRRRVGDVALNQGEIETAADIASAVRAGGFPAIRGTLDRRATAEA